LIELKPEMSKAKQNLSAGDTTAQLVIMDDSFTEVKH